MLVGAFDGHVRDVRDGVGGDGGRGPLRGTGSSSADLLLCTERRSMHVMSHIGDAEDEARIRQGLLFAIACEACAAVITHPSDPARCVSRMYTMVLAYAPATAASALLARGGSLELF